MHPEPTLAATHAMTLPDQHWAGEWAYDPTRGWVPTGAPPPRTMRWGCGDIGFGLLAMFVLTFVAILPVVMVAAVQGGGAASEIDTNSPVIAILGLAATWGGLGGWSLIASKWRGLGTLRDDFQYWFRWPDDLGLGLVGGVVAIVAGALVAAAESALKIEAISNGQFLTDSWSTSRRVFVVLGLGAAVGAPVVEELFFRGLAFTAIQRRLGTGWAVALSTVLFGILHFQAAPSAAAAAFLVIHITVFGLVLGLLRARTGRCGAGVIAHMTINSFGVLLVMFGVG